MVAGRLVRRVGYVGTTAEGAAGLSRRGHERAALELYGGWERLCACLPASGPELLGVAKQFKRRRRVCATDQRDALALPPGNGKQKRYSATCAWNLRSGLPTAGWQREDHDAAPRRTPMSAPTLFDTAPRFNGPAYDPALDHQRLTRQLGRVFDLVQDGRWRTLQEIADATGDPHASISAQLRHLRKPRFGGYAVEKRRRSPYGGTWEYRLVLGDEGKQQ
jgi:hypothetical protein